ncbi:MAG: hypothetical protein JWM10_5334 [Myxococcaceae bacterium]|nr:hypothetical protein [Myxococcaceae bacterium]
MNLRATLLAAVALTPALAFAQPAAPDAQARAAFDRGIADVDAGRFANAVAAFEESYRLRPAAVVLYNLASAYSRLGRHQQAIATYERYLAEGGARLPADRVQSVRTRIAELRRDLPVVVLRVRPAPFALTVDGRPQTVTGDEVALDPGSHLLVATAPSRAPQQREVQLAPGARVTWDVELVAEASAPATPVVAAAPVEVSAPAVTPHPRREPMPATAAPTITSRWWFWTGIGVVVAGGTLAVLGASGAFDTVQGPVGGTAYDVSAIRW